MSTSTGRTRQNSRPYTGQIGSIALQSGQLATNPANPSGRQPGTNSSISVMEADIHYLKLKAESLSHNDENDRLQRVALEGKVDSQDAKHLKHIDDLQTELKGSKAEVKDLKAELLKLKDKESKDSFSAHRRSREYITLTMARLQKHIEDLQVDLKVSKAEIENLQKEMKELKNPKCLEQIIQKIIDSQIDTAIFGVARVLEASGKCICAQRKQDADQDIVEQSKPIEQKDEPKMCQWPIPPAERTFDLSSLPDLVRDGDSTTAFETSVDDIDDTTFASSIADTVKSNRGGRPDRKRSSPSVSLAPEQKRPKVGEPKV